MENKSHAMAAGVFVLSVLALLVALAVWLTRDNGDSDLYEMSTNQTISGLQAQAPVRYRGVPVGKVEFIGFDPKVRGNVLVRISVARGTPITRSTFAAVGMQGVTGLGFIQLDEEGSATELLAANDLEPPRIPLRPGLLDKLFVQAETIMSQFEQASTSLNSLLSPDNQSSVNAAVKQIGEAAGSISQLAKAAEPTVAALPALTRQAGETLGALRTAAGDVSLTSQAMTRTADRLTEKGGPLDQVAQGSAALASTIETFGAATLPKLGSVADETTRTMRQLRRTVSTVDDNPQSLLFGDGAPRPGPGEPGFSAQGARP
jgi:phospholipid/cholesterol/gamma-HCH transport system substrate-binding protein